MWYDGIIKIRAGASRPCRQECNMKRFIIMRWVVIIVMAAMLISVLVMHYSSRNKTDAADGQNTTVETSVQEDTGTQEE